MREALKKLKRKIDFSIILLMNNNDSEGKEKNKNFTVFDSFLTVEVNSSAGFFRF